jgi:hypothetical protein
MTRSAQIIAFPARGAANEAATPAVAHSSTTPHIKAKVLTTNGVKNWLLKTPLIVLRYCTFLILSWISGPVRWILRLIAAISLLTLPVVAIGLENDPHKVRMMAMLAGVGLGSYAVAWFYGVLLYRLNPTQVLLD